MTGRGPKVVSCLRVVLVDGRSSPQGGEMHNKIPSKSGRTVPGLRGLTPYVSCNPRRPESAREFLVLLPDSTLFYLMPKS